MIDAIRNGADGIISVAANVYPKIMVETYNQIISDTNSVELSSVSSFYLRPCSSKRMVISVVTMIFSIIMPPSLTTLT